MDTVLYEIDTLNLIYDSYPKGDTHVLAHILDRIELILDFINNLSTRQLCMYKNAVSEIISVISFITEHIYQDI